MTSPQLTLWITGHTLIDNTTDIYAICDVIKSFFRTLPEPVIPSTMYFTFIDSASKLSALPGGKPPHLVFKKLKVLSLVWRTSGASFANSPLRISIL